jgi:hypothetical protein
VSASHFSHTKFLEFLTFLTFFTPKNQNFSHFPHQIFKKITHFGIIFKDLFEFLDDFSQIIDRKKTSSEKTSKNPKKKILSSHFNQAVTRHQGALKQI